MASSLIPKAGKWMDENLNVLLVGLHGVGKTTVVVDLCKKRGMKLKYYSCSTLDPYTDLVGVPVPVVDDDGQRRLEMVRPRDVDEAEIIFFDEFNRADPKVHNALMEIIMFRSINGEPLPNLRMVWAAMNPPGQVYDVEELDPALIDRFDVFEDVTAAPSPEYLASRGIRAGVAKALCAWWKDHGNKRDEQITPRRLEKIGLLYEKTGDCKSAIPNWFSAVDRGKLKAMLADVENREKGAATGSGGAPTDRFEYSDEYFKREAYSVAEYLRSNQKDLETHRAAKEVVANRHAPRLVRDFGEIIDAFIPSVREGMLTEMNQSKFDRLVEEINKVPDWRREALANFKKAVEAEAALR